MLKLKVRLQKERWCLAKKNMLFFQISELLSNLARSVQNEKMIELHYGNRLTCDILASCYCK